MNIPCPWRTGGRIGTSGGPGATAKHCRDSTGECLVDLLRANKMNMRIEATGRHDMPLGGNHLSTCTNHHTFGHASLNQWISRVADAGDAPIFDSDIRFDDAQDRVNDGGIG